MFQNFQLFLNLIRIDDDYRGKFDNALVRKFSDVFKMN